MKIIYAVVIVCLMSLSSCIHTQKLSSEKQPPLLKPSGPYQLARQYKNLVFVSGQLGIDPISGALKHDLKSQTEQIMENLKTILESNHSDVDHVLKTVIYLTDIEQIQLVNEVYASYFKENLPARSTIQVVALPRHALIEIECIAMRK